MLRVSKKKLLWAPIVVVLLVVVGAFLYLFLRPEQTLRAGYSAQTIYSDESSVVESDVVLPTISEFQAKYSDFNELYNQLITASSQKESFGKNSEALEYLNAALQSVDGADTDKQKSTKYLIYLFGVRTGNNEVADKYMQDLGVDYINAKNKEVGDYEYNR